MKKLITKASVIYLVLCQNAYAVLPKAPTPSTASTSSDGLTYFTGLFKDGLQFIGLAISGAGFCWQAWNLLSDLNQARTGRKEWGEVGLAGVVGVVIFGYVSYLLLQSSNVI